MKWIAGVSFVLVALVGCAGNTGDDCGGTVGSESHWANCGENSATNNGSTDAGYVNNGATDTGNISTNNTSTNNTSTNNNSGNNMTSPDMGMLEVCYAFRWDDTDRVFDEARCAQQDDGSFLCDCFDLGETPSIAVTCADALAECGATVEEIEGCAMTDEAGCTATDTGWECMCQGLDGVFQSDLELCDAAYYDSCYGDDYCTADIDDLEGRCTPVIEADYTSSGYLCGCYADGVETIAPVMIDRPTCDEAAAVACGE